MEKTSHRARARSTAAMEFMVDILGPGGYSGIHMSRSTGTLAERLKELREEAGISCREVARLAGCAQAIVSRTERSEKGISRATAERLARLFGCSLDWLCMGNGPRPDDAAVLASVKKAARRRPRAKVQSGRSKVVSCRVG